MECCIRHDVYLWKTSNLASFTLILQRFRLFVLSVIAAAATVLRVFGSKKRFFFFFCISALCFCQANNLKKNHSRWADASHPSSKLFY